MELLAEDVDSEDDLTRLRAYRRIRLVAEAIGPNATDTELLPFLTGGEPARPDLPPIYECPSTIHHSLYHYLSSMSPL